MINVQPFIDKLESLKEYIALAIDGKLWCDTGKAVFWYNLLLPTTLTDDQINEIWETDFSYEPWAYSPAKFSIHYPFEKWHKQFKLTT